MINHNRLNSSSRTKLNSRSLSPNCLDPDLPNDFEEEQAYVQKLKLQRQKIQLLKSQFVKLENQLGEREKQICRLQCTQCHKNQFRTPKTVELIEKLQSQNRLLRNQCEKRVELTVDEFTVQIQEERRCHRQRELQLNKEIQELMITNRQLQFQVQQLKGSQNEKDVAYRNQMNTIKTRWQTLKNDTISARRQIQQLGQENSVLTSKISMLQNQVKFHKEEADTCKSNNQELSQLLFTKDEEIDDLKSQLDRQLNRYANQLINERQERQKIIVILNKLKSSLSDSRAAQSNLQIRIDELVRGLDIQTKKFNQAVNQNNRLQQSIKNLQSHLDSLKRQAQQNRRGKQIMMQKVQGLESRSFCDKKSKYQNERLRRQLQAKRRCQVDLIQSVFQSFPKLKEDQYLSGNFL